MVNALYIDCTGLGKLRSVYGRQKYVELRREEWKHGKLNLGFAALRAKPRLFNAPTTYLLINSRQLISIQRNFNVAGKHWREGEGEGEDRREKPRWKVENEILSPHFRSDTELWRGRKICTWTIFFYTLCLLTSLSWEKFNKKEREIWNKNFFSQSFWFQNLLRDCKYQ